MQRYSICFLAALIAASVFSCKKKKKEVIVPQTPPGPTVVTYPDYAKLKPGNYWIYQNYKVDSVTGASHALGTFDSCFVEKDTVLHGKSYHKLLKVSFGSSGSHPAYDTYLLTDSLSYIVNHNGKILFSSNDFVTIFRSGDYTNPAAGIPDTITVTEQMDFKDAYVTVPAGTFKTSTFRQIYHIPQYSYGPTREYNTRYAENVGIVSEITGWFMASPMWYERRLERYYVR